MVERIRVGVVGAGRYARIALLPTLRARSDVAVVAVVDPAPDAGVYPDVEAFLHSGNASCAVVAIPHETHGPILTRLLDAGLDLFSEWPLSLDLGEAHRIVDLAAQRGRILIVGFNRRYAPACVAAKTAFAGSPVDFTSALKARATLLFEGIHLLDLVWWYCGGAVQAGAASARSLNPAPTAGSTRRSTTSWIALRTGEPP